MHQRWLVRTKREPHVANCIVAPALVAWPAFVVHQRNFVRAAGALVCLTIANHHKIIVLPKSVLSIQVLQPEAGCSTIALRIVATRRRWPRVALRQGIANKVQGYLLDEIVACVVVPVIGNPHIGWINCETDKTALMRPRCRMLHRSPR